MGWGEAWDHVGKEDVPLPHPTPQQVPGAERAQTRLQKETGDPGWAGRRLRWGLGGSPSWGGGSYFTAARHCPVSPAVPWTSLPSSRLPVHPACSPRLHQPSHPRLCLLSCKAEPPD